VVKNRRSATSQHLMVRVFFELAHVSPRAAQAPFRASLPFAHRRTASAAARILAPLYLCSKNRRRQRRCGVYRRRRAAASRRASKTASKAAHHQWAIDVRTQASLFVFSCALFHCARRTRCHVLSRILNIADNQMSKIEWSLSGLCMAARFAHLAAWDNDLFYVGLVCL